ncbi:ferredoxin-type protein NapF [Cribrihabitans marinus]|uniref:Ferredoxin-type protein NapF n=1 Tax=Cribrihabitans marinus TaxID=1227549 RepID=A0A1H6W1X9_9RHOB|nr:ferredoxin-type protein NapF [Cribrihabitans marinus]GGH24806.1 ferredoxin-type protein NapF [Cribrihabitans marinus]SEJ10939.1 ferredoxin-type protein NapF [Cribrihabitans marinus]
MATRHSRRNLLRGRFRKTETPAIHPPGAQPDFGNICDECGDCINACPEAILISSSRGPVVDFSRGGCTFCGECARACPTGALQEALVPDWPWRAEVGAKCLAFQGVSCRACEDACDRRAIRFRLMTAGRAVPVIDQDQCNGCGECAFVCPALAIGLEISQACERTVTT